MCGIAGLVGWHRGESRFLQAGDVLESIAHRGPDDRGFAAWDGVGGVRLYHTRLAIQDLDPRAKCPFDHGEVTLVYNGELWNTESVRAALPPEDWQTTGDTEVVAAALDEWGIDALPRLEGMFALAWADDPDRVHLARDRFGEIPLHLVPLGDRYETWDGQVVADGFAFSSELKSLRRFASLHGVSWVEPGTAVTLRRLPTGRWSAKTTRWYEAPAEPVPMTLEDAGVRMRGLMETAVSERAVSDVPVCTLLSGGIDSTAVAYHLRRHVSNLVAYTAVYDEKSQDLRMARLAAEALEIELREVKVPVPSRDDLVDVIRRIEMPYKAQVEIGWPCLWLARQMREDGFKVCFSGEGSDELWASYGFNYHVLRRTFAGRDVFGGPSQVWRPEQERTWSEYRRDLFTTQHRKNFPRCNKVFMAHGVECRLPFLHTPLVEFALSCPVDVTMTRNDGKGPSKQKAVMYEAWNGLVPDAIVKRHKVAFQDGMGIKQAITREFDWTTRGPASGGPTDNGQARSFYTNVYKEVYT